MQLPALVRKEKGTVARARRWPEPRLRRTRADKGEDACLRGFDACSHSELKVERHLHFLHGCLAQHCCKNGRQIENNLNRLKPNIIKYKAPHLPAPTIKWMRGGVAAGVESLEARDGNGGAAET